MKRKMTLAILALAMCCGIATAQQHDGLIISHLGANNTLIKVDATHRYLMLPVEEQAPEANINVLLNGGIDQQINVRLAQSRTDYYVPFVLDKYKGKRIVLDIRTGNDRTNVRDQHEDVCWKEIRFSETFDSANVEKFRPAFHHTPVYGWMNDPNGMFYKDGVYHLYYQHNPYGSLWGNMNWGHSTSRDLIHWTHEPVAIAPDALGTVFSGSAVVDKDNTAGFGHDAIIAMYTSAGITQRQSLAYSTDNGLTFSKYIDNPVVTSDKECRDDKIIWNAATGRWILVLADALEHQDWFYSSSDLKHWTKESSFGQGYGAQNGVWECPDLMQLPVKGTNEKKWVLIVNLNPGGLFGGSATQYFVGDFDGKNFTCDSKPGVTKWMDFGKDHYATVSWSNAPEGRHTVIAWMSNWQYANTVPTKQFRSANSLPRDISLFRDDDGEYYLCTVPAKEMDALRGKIKRYGSFKAEAKAVTKKLPKDGDGLYEIDLTLDIRGTASITLSNAQGNKVVMTYDAYAHTFGMDRTKSGIVNFSSDFPCITSAPTSHSNSQSLRLFIDRCSIEAFDGEGRFVMTNLVFPENPYTDISITNSLVNTFNVYNIKK